MAQCVTYGAMPAAHALIAHALIFTMHLIASCTCPVLKGVRHSGQGKFVASEFFLQYARMHPE